jgi:hypothetical protein
MRIYSVLFESLIDCFYQMGFRHGLVYTAAMMTLGLSFCLNLLSFIDLLWSLGVLQDPYLSNGARHPQHYVYALLSSALLANSLLGRIKFRADRQCLCPAPELQMPELEAPPISMPRFSMIRAPGLAYALGSTVLFLATLTLALLTRA